ncbi:hypothetical protein M378DRAFT_20867 [Amanita muscaria Koide BX008]|uniref:Uncharacterized protein n=1 Tax=Amanita muscaria (strain Koide BX008) TaxID=946122 RepID=A0A0C2X819_AMAMK|nr:hypothetical protein M378DRAFT_20867 [Amanita muscaria Koide BX008]
MALNWTMLTNNRTPVPLQNEMTITSVDAGVDLTLSIPDTPPAGSSQSGGSGGARKLRAMGKIWLTDQRLLFASSPAPPSINSGSSSASSAQNNLDTLTIPLPSILSTKFEQPTFGSNYLTFEIKPSPEGELTEGTSALIRFKDRAMFEFVSLLEKTRERAIYMRRQQMMEDEAEEGLPSYSLPTQSSSVTMVGSVPVENPPGYEL